MCCQTWAMVMPSCINPMANIMLPLWELGKSLPWAFQRSWNHETPPLAIPSRPGHRSAEFPPAPSFWRLGKNKTFFEGFLGTQSASLNQLKGNSSLYKKRKPVGCIVWRCVVHVLLLDLLKPKWCGELFAKHWRLKLHDFQLHSCPRQSMLPKETNISGSNIREYWHYLWRSRYLVPFCLA